jgi:hypothetical protein
MEIYSKEVGRLPLLITHLVPKDERSLAGAGGNAAWNIAEFLIQLNYIFLYSPSKETI